MEKIKNWLITWFSENTEAVVETLQQTWNSNYVEQGLIDSFQFLGLIADVENSFGFSFTEEDLTDGAILTLKGLAEKIDRLTGKEA